MSTGATPYSLVYGMEAVLPIELDISFARILAESGISEAELIQKRVDHLYLIDEKRIAALCHGQAYQRRMAAAYNKKVRPRVFQPGDLVIKRMLPKERHPRGKLAPNYSGPLIVKKVLPGNALVLVEDIGSELPSLVNADVVKKYYA